LTRVQDATTYQRRGVLFSAWNTGKCLEVSGGQKNGAFRLRDAVQEANRRRGSSIGAVRAGMNPPFTLRIALRMSRENDA
jgi:hypothetical protein